MVRACPILRIPTCRLVRIWVGIVVWSGSGFESSYGPNLGPVVGWVSGDVRVSCLVADLSWILDIGNLLVVRSFLNLLL